MPIRDESTALYQIQPVSFVYKSDQTNRKTYGLIAEDVYEKLPEIVVTSKNENGEDMPETIQYHLLPPLLLDLIQKQKFEIETLRTFAKELQNETQNLRQECSSIRRNYEALQVEVQTLRFSISLLENRLAFVESR
jgi:FtsZ-binding cell division protein ZapB